MVDGPVERKERIEQDRIEELESEVRGNKEVIEGLRKDMGVKVRTYSMDGAHNPEVASE